MYKLLIFTLTINQKKEGAKHVFSLTSNRYYPSGDAFASGSDDATVSDQRLYFYYSTILHTSPLISPQISCPTEGGSCHAAGKTFKLLC